MRENSRAMRADPAFSIVTDPRGKTWGKLSAPSVRAMHDLARKYANTPNEASWLSAGSDWLGLDTQRVQDFHSSGIARYPRDLVKSLSVAMPAKLSRMANPRAAVTGSFWDTPSVLANLPLAARTRQREKLAPLSLKFVICMSAFINAQDMAKISARIARAVWDYTMRGGTVNLTVYNIGFVRRAEGGECGLMTETRVNASDVAAISLAMSPAFFRAVTGPLMTAFSDYSQDSIPVPQLDDNPIPGAYFLGGRMEASLKNANDVIKAMDIT